MAVSPFLLNLREVEEMMLACGVLVTYETIHQRCRKFGHAFANQPPRRRPRPGDKWHLDEVFIKVKETPAPSGQVVSAIAVCEHCCGLSYDVLTW